MTALLICMLAYVVIGAAGMYLGARKVSSTEAFQRWLKYGVYILITIIMLICITQKVFIWLAVFIIVVGLYEVVKAAYFNAALLVKAILIYLFIAFGFIGFIINHNDRFLLYIYFQVFTFDAFSQVCGQLFGNRKLAPKISAGKTIEGFIGGSLFCILSAVVGKNYMDISLLKSIAFASFTAITGLVGDLLASYLKRRSHIKDYSKLLPGQGGFLDRFDSLIMCGCCYFIFWMIMQ